MENKSEETVTLVLKGKRFEVEKQKLTDKSQYFAALLSANYRDHLQTEHIINFDISLISLQDFIDWIHGDTLTSYDTKKFDRVVNLLNLSVLFAVDNLIEIITNKLDKHYMSPRYVIKIWLLAQELNINMLRDLSFSICLDRFDELSLNSIYELSRENFLKLIGNINVRSTEFYLHHIAQEWMNHHNDFTIPLDILKNKKEKILYSIISSENDNNINSKQFILCWDDKDLFELTSFKYPEDITIHSVGKNILTGMQIAARRHDLYICGGEYGIGSGKFNTNVWRYSLISKKWHLETNMPVSRRNMITVLFKNKLVLMGGVGRYRQKLRTVDIYNIYTGRWSVRCTDIPLEFVSVPEYFVFEDVIIYRHKNVLHIYFPDTNRWERIDLEYTSRSLNNLLFRTIPCYIDIDDSDNGHNLILRIVTEIYNKENCPVVPHNPHCHTFSICYKINCNCYNIHAICETLFTIFYTSFKSNSVHPLTVHPLRKDIALICPSFKTKPEMLHIQSLIFPLRNQKKLHSFIKYYFNPSYCFVNPPCLKLIHPAHLHTTNLDHI
ncbi:uncharacterized protein LOC105834793 [Monomorium pharaonis]|uniref:uncharacterized protein LOC105834793 n=1 Tax=Monomorium pharaonis TaxID=307658 RepID=UPI00063F89E1|nr:uncharacterized protein LOC105834793 [Monomorium pharaonis]